MSIPNEPESKNSEVKQESYTDINGNTHTDFTRTTETVKNNAANPNSYTNGYVQGRNVERSNQADLAQRDENNASGGLLLGIIITSLLGLVIGGVWYFNQQNNAAVKNAVPVVVPVPSKSSPTPQPQTTIIERTREVPVPVAVPVPQQQVIPPSAPPQPDINITVPPQQPAAEKAPSVTQPSPKATQSSTTSPTTNTPSSQNDSSNTVTPGTKSDTSQNTPPQGVNEPNSTSNSGSSTTDDTTGGSAQ